MNIQILFAFLILHSVSSGWMPWLNDTQPSVNGISAGLNQRSEEVYVGLATFKQQTSPGELIISGENIGLHFIYGKSVLHLKSEIKYYVKESDCEYHWVATSKGVGVLNAIRVLSPPYTFYVGRFFTGESYHVGSMNLQHRVFYYSFNETMKTSRMYEILTCKRRYTTIRTTHRPNLRRGSNSELEAMNAEIKTLKEEINELKVLITKNLKANSTNIEVLAEVNSTNIEET